MENIKYFEEIYFVLVLLFLIIIYLTTNKIDYIIFIFYIVISILINFILKEYIFRPIMNNNTYKFIGSGIRPDATRNCTNLLDNNILISMYGMPSGHSQTLLLICTLLFLKILNEKYSLNKKIIKCLVLFIVTGFLIYERLYYNCHTYQQIIIGGLIGIILGIIGFNNLIHIKNII